VPMKAPCAQGKNLNIQPPRGPGGYPKFFFTPNLILFVSINSVQNFKTVALPLLGEKFVVGGGGGGGGGWWVVICEFSVLLWSKPFALELKIWTWTKPNNCWSWVHIV
jgi:hypothetical protein